MVRGLLLVCFNGLAIDSSTLRLPGPQKVIQIYNPFLPVARSPRLSPFLVVSPEESRHIAPPGEGKGEGRGREKEDATAPARKLKCYELPAGEGGRIRTKLSTSQRSSSCCKTGKKSSTDGVSPITASCFCHGECLASSGDTSLRCSRNQAKHATPVTGEGEFSCAIGVHRR